MSVLQLLIILAVLATLYWAAGHHPPTNHAENDAATSRGDYQPCSIRPLSSGPTLRGTAMTRFEC